MLNVSLGLPPRGPLTLLCLGAHADDIEIGCGATLLQLIAERPRSTVHWVVMSADARRAKEARESARRLLRGRAVLNLELFDFRDGFLRHEGAAVKDRFEALKRGVEPDLVFTHHSRDAHQDHRFVSDLTRQTFRDHLVLEYEIPKYDGDLGRPNLFVPIAPTVRRRKVRHLMSSFPSQRAKRWYSADTFDGLMRLRGIECGAPEGYAEAFFARKLVLGRTSNSGRSR